MGNIQRTSLIRLPKAIQYEHPELFYVNLRQFSYKISRRSDNFGNNDQRPFHYGKDEIKEAQKLIDAECNEIVSYVPKDATELEKCFCS